MSHPTFRWISVFAISLTVSCSHAPREASRAGSYREPAAERASEAGVARGLYVSAGDAILPAPPAHLATPIYSILRGARQSIDIEIYQMTDHAVRKELRAAMARKVRIRLVKDPVTLGEKCPIYFAEKDPVAKTTSYRLAGLTETRPNARGRVDADCQDQRKLVREITGSGGTVVAFNKPELCAGGGTACYQHGKLVLADGAVAMVSSGNFNSSNLCNLRPNPINRKVTGKCNRDYTYVLDADRGDRLVVEGLREVFSRDLGEKAHDVAEVVRPRSELSRKLTVSPYSLEPLVAFVRSARRSIQLENQYLKVPELNDALVAAARRGVQVTVVLASLCSFGKPKGSAARSATAIFSAFDAAGVTTRFFTAANSVSGKPGYMHAKAIVVDETRAWMGSVNGSSMSTSKNREYGVFFEEPSSVALLKASIEHDAALDGNESWQESLECLKDRGSVESEETDGG